MTISFLNLCPLILNMLSYSSDYQSAEVSVIAQHNEGSRGAELVETELVTQYQTISEHNERRFRNTNIIGFSMYT